MGLEIIATQVYIPSKRVLNEELEIELALEKGAVQKLTEIKERRSASDSESPCQMGVETTAKLLSGGFDLNEIGLIIYGTNTPGSEQYMFGHEFALKLETRVSQRYFGEILFMPGGCTLTIHQLRYAQRYLLENPDKLVLCVTSTDQTKFLDPIDKATRILFGDLATAIIVQFSEKKVIFKETHDFSGYRALFYDRETKMRMPCGRSVYGYVIKNILQFVRDLKGSRQIDWFLFHQANGRMLNTIQDRLEIPEGKTINTYEYFGNTGCCSLYFGLHTGIQEGHIKKGDTIMIVGYGIGYEMNGCILEL